jgi:hypothetical protein
VITHQSHRGKIKNTKKLLHIGIFTATLLSLANSLFAQEVVSTITAGEKVDVDFTAARVEFESAYADLAISEPEVAEYMRQEFESFERGELRFGDFERSFVEQGFEGMREGFESHYQEALARGDTLAAEMMKAGFEACERGEYAAVGQMDFTAMRTEFEQHYQEALAKGDFSEAEQMKQGWEAFEKGDVRSVMMDPEEMKDAFEKAYQEALASGDTQLAEQMKGQFDAHIEHYESGGASSTMETDAAREMFEKAYQDALAQGDTQHAEMMKQGYEQMQAEMQQHDMEQQQPDQQQPDQQQPDQQQPDQQQFETERNTEQIQEQNMEKYQHCLLNPGDPACQH